MKKDNQATDISAYTGHARQTFVEFYRRFRDADSPDLFILNRKKPISCSGFKEWAGWLISHDAERLVAKTTIGRACVLTVFTGDSRGWPKQCPRLVFETMVFDANHVPWDEQFPCRYSTWAAAERGHARAVESVKHCLALRQRRRKTTARSRSHQHDSASQSPRRKLTLLCQEHRLIAHHHRGQIFFWRQDFTAGCVKDAIAYAEGYGAGYQDAIAMKPAGTDVSPIGLRHQEPQAHRRSPS